MAEIHLQWCLRLNRENCAKQTRQDEDALSGTYSGILHKKQENHDLGPKTMTTAARDDATTGDKGIGGALDQAVLRRDGEAGFEIEPLNSVDE
jgi:hypothetical protein